MHEVGSTSARLFLTASLAIAVGCGGGRANSTGGATTGGAGAGGTGSTTTGGHGGGGSSSGSGGGSGDGCGDPEAMMPAWVAAAAPTTEIYVSPSGDDANDGSAPDHALLTSLAAFAKLGPGVRLNFAAGTYGCGVFVQNIVATSADPAIVLSSDGPRKAVFDCSADMGDGLSFSQVSGLVFEGIELHSPLGHGIHVASAQPPDPNNLPTDIVLHDSYIHDTGGASLKASQMQRLWVIGNEVTGAAGGSMNFELLAVDDAIIAGNLAHDTSGPLDEIKGGSQRGLIYRNVVHDSSGGILAGGDCTGVQFLVDPTIDYEASDLVVWDNVVYDDVTDAFRIVGCHDCTIANNTFYTPAPSALMRIQPDGFGDASGCAVKVVNNQNLHIQNNVFASTSLPGYAITGTTDQTMGMVMTNNAWWAGAGNDVTKIGTDIPFAGDPASLYAIDPMLTAPPMNVSPAAGSPLLGKGVAITGIPGNAAGVCWSGAPDIGAY